jgi:hypothetical protein
MKQKTTNRHEFTGRWRVGSVGCHQHAGSWDGARLFLPAAAIIKVALANVPNLTLMPGVLELFQPRSIVAVSSHIPGFVRFENNAFHFPVSR